LVRAAPGFAFVTTSNTGGGGDETGMYGGTRVQNLAFRDRFIKLMVDYPDKDTEMGILEGYFPGMDKRVAGGFIDVANMVRSAFMAGTGMDVTFSTRTLIRWVRLTAQFGGMQDRGVSPVHYALDLALANGTSEAISETLHTMVQQVIGVARHVPQAV